MAKMKISTLDQLRKFVLNPKIATYDKYFVFKNALKAYPIIFIDLVSDEGEKGIRDLEHKLIPDMLRILSDIEADPKANHYKGMTVSISGYVADSNDIIIDFRE